MMEEQPIGSAASGSSRRNKDGEAKVQTALRLFELELGEGGKGRGAVFMSLRGLGSTLSERNGEERDTVMALEFGAAASQG